MPPRASVPEAALLPCPDCGEEQVHDVLRASGARGAQDATVRCRACARVHRAVLRHARHVPVPIIVSRGAASERAVVELPEDEVVALQDELVAAGRQVQVRAVEHRNGKRVRRAAARDIATLWARDFEELEVKVAVNLGPRTVSRRLVAGPRDTFTVGDELEVEGRRVAVHAIRTREATLHRGTAEAKDVKRLFARPVPKPKQRGRAAAGQSPRRGAGRAGAGRRGRGPSRGTAARRGR